MLLFADGSPLSEVGLFSTSQEQLIKVRIAKCDAVERLPPNEVGLQLNRISLDPIMGHGHRTTYPEGTELLD